MNDEKQKQAFTRSSSLPLYVQVALWVMSRGPADRDAIAREFALTPRHASDIMTYITCRRKDVVEAVKVVTEQGGGLRTAVLEVRAVNMDNVPVRGASPGRRKRQQGSDMRAMTDLFLGRRSVP